MDHGAEVRRHVIPPSFVTSRRDCDALLLPSRSTPDFALTICSCTGSGNPAGRPQSDIRRPAGPGTGRVGGAVDKAARHYDAMA